MALFLTFPSLVFGAPSIGGVSGTIADGHSVTISGSGFGNNSAQKEWLGGSDGMIESGIIGQVPSRANWSFGTSWADTYIAEDYVHSGNKSLKVSTNSDGLYNGDIRYNSNRQIGPGEEIFVSWWTRRNHVNTGQWKMFRLDFENDITDGPYQLNMFNHDTQRQFVVRPGPDAEANLWQSWSPPYPSQDDRWYRLDLMIHISDYGVYNGTYAMNRHDPVSGSPIVNMTLTDRLSFIDSNGFYQWFVWQNYMGNGITSQDVWTDDIFVQVGSVARIEIGDDPNWDNCTFREIQYPNSWNSNQIVIYINEGLFSGEDDAYLYIVDENGGVNEAGYPITFSSSEDDAIAPSSPIGLGVI